MKLVITDTRKVSQFAGILKNLKNFSIDIEFHVNHQRLSPRNGFCYDVYLN